MFACVGVAVWGGRAVTHQEPQLREGVRDIDHHSADGLRQRPARLHRQLHEKASPCANYQIPNTQYQIPNTKYQIYLQHRSNPQKHNARSSSAVQQHRPAFTIPDPSTIPTKRSAVRASDGCCKAHPRGAVVNNNAGVHATCAKRVQPCSATPQCQECAQQVYDSPHTDVGARIPFTSTTIRANITADETYSDVNSGFFFEI